MSQDHSLDSFREAVGEETQRYWERESRAFGLAKMGQILIQRGFNVKKLLGRRRLSEFIEQELSGSVRVLHDDNPLVLGAVPWSVTLPSRASELFKKKVLSGSTSSQVTRFKPVVWAAFSKPLDGDRVRRLLLSEPISFADVPGDADRTDSEYDIDERLIVPYSALKGDARREKISDNIAAWAREAGIDLGLLTALPPASSTNLEESNVLVALIRSLSTEERARVALPLDIVDKLMKSRIG